MAEPTPTKRALTFKEAAELVPCDPRMIARAVQAGRLPTVQFGARRLIPRAALERYLDSGAA